MIRVKKKKKIKRKKMGNVKTTERTTKKGGNVSQVVNVYVTKGGGGRRKAPVQRPTFFQSQPQLFTANYDNTLLNQIQPIQDKYIKMFNTNNDLLNKLLTKQRTSDSSIQTDTLTNDKLFTKETQTTPEKIPVFRPADTQTEPMLFNTEKEEGDLADLLNPTRPQPQRATGEIGTPQNPSLPQVKAKEIKKLKIRIKKSVLKDRPNVTSDFVEGGGVDVKSPTEELEDLVMEDFIQTTSSGAGLGRSPSQAPKPAPTPPPAEEGNLESQLSDLKTRAKANNIKLRRGMKPKTPEAIRKQIRYYSEAIAIIGSNRN